MTSNLTYFIIDRSDTLHIFLYLTAPLRVIKNGCFDPIRKTQTVNARCLSNRHCNFLENTECVPNYQDPGVKTCRCKKGTLPKPHLKDTGLVPGCEESEFTKMLSVEHCKRRFTLGAHTVSQKIDISGPSRAQKFKLKRWISDGN